MPEHPPAPWFGDARLGIFVHWGIYSVDGVGESWSFFNGHVSHDAYYSQLDRFRPEHADLRAWARMFREAGARYAVLTTKHHDGVCLWPTATGSPVVPPVAAGRDLVGEWCEALRAEGLRVGLYHSHLDWLHPDYASVRPDGADPDERGNPYSQPAAGQEDPAAWERFVAFRDAQVRELLERYQPDLLWFDGDWERSEQQWRMAELRQLIAETSPHTVCNGRMLGQGDYATPEQGVPVVPPDGPWELCLTMNDSWGWQGRDTHFKPVHRLLRTLVEAAAAGGNLLLAVGPDADGVIREPYAARLRELGNWLARHREAVDAGPGLPPGCFDGPSTLSADGRTLYLFCFFAPQHELCVRGLGVEVTGARVLDTGAGLVHEQVGGHLDNAGWLYVQLDAAAAPAQVDPLCTVVALDLAQPLTLRTHHTRD